uniref:Uncharacterized protein n=1 Tax=Rhizophora mucronata TaxID=61149 RepID=A0A2P2PBL7_RHIMU
MRNKMSVKAHRR